MIKDTELRFVIRSEMTNDELERLLYNVGQEIKDTLVDQEELICSHQTDKISYESRQAIRELGEE